MLNVGSTCKLLWINHIRAEKLSWNSKNSMSHEPSTACLCSYLWGNQCQVCQPGTLLLSAWLQAIKWKHSGQIWLSLPFSRTVLPACLGKLCAILRHTLSVQSECPLAQMSVLGRTNLKEHIQIAKMLGITGYSKSGQQRTEACALQGSTRLFLSRNWPGKH